MKKIFNNKKYISCFKKQSRKLAVVFVVVSMLFYTLNVKEIVAYYTDIEKSNNNSFSAAMLDFRLTDSSFSDFVGKEYKGEKDTATISIPVTGSLGMQYKVSTIPTSPICDQFTLKAERNEILVYSGIVSDFNVPTSTEFGTFDFEFDLPVEASVTEGDLCQADFVFEAWREDIVDQEQSGYSDVETFSINLNAKTIVLNEVLANPDSSYPYPANKEYIELKNNGNMPVDIAGWKVSELTGGGVEHGYNITTTSGSYTAIPYGGTTVIPAGGWIVLLLSDGTALNNGGDTIRLYNNISNKLDEYSYTSSKYGMSDARYLDGVGDWVDPIPTPGMSNELTEEIIPTEIIEVVPEPIVLDEENKENEPTSGGATITEEPVIIEEENTTTPEEIDTEIKDEEIITTEEPVEEEVMTEVPPVTEPEEVVTEEEEIIETPTEPVEPEEIPQDSPEEIIEEIKEEIVVPEIIEEEVKEEIIVEEPIEPEEVIEVKVEEPAPAVVEEVTVSE